MISVTSTISLRKSALTAGITILLLVIMAPYAELYVYPKLVVTGNAEETFKNIVSNKLLFISGLFSYAFTDIGDIVVAWAVYLLLAPVNKSLSLLTAWFRLIYSIISIVALLNLVTVVHLLDNTGNQQASMVSQSHTQVMYLIETFRYSFHFGILFFAIHLILSGFLVIKAKFIPTTMGILLLISGFGYLVDILRPFFYPNFNMGFITVTFFGELIFMLWLLFKGSKIQEPVFKQDLVTTTK